jgi:hypothetical protein
MPVDISYMRFRFGAGAGSVFEFGDLKFEHFRIQHLGICKLQGGDLLCIEGDSTFLGLHIWSLVGSGTGQDPDGIFRDPDPEIPNFWTIRDLSRKIPPAIFTKFSGFSGIFRD